MQERFFADFGELRTAEGQTLGVVLWKGRIQNHIANVLLTSSKTSTRVCEWERAKGGVRLTGGKGQYSSVALLTLPVYDLYYKKSRAPLGDWWSGLDSQRAGTVKIGLRHAIED